MSQFNKYCLVYDGESVRLRAILRGVFFFELASAILTNVEHIIRNYGIDDGKTYSLQLDADWATDNNDNNALCLDATHYGNVGRFLNHRWFTSS
jgi:hypothetical protein